MLILNIIVSYCHIYWIYFKIKNNPTDLKILKAECLIKYKNVIVIMFQL